MVIIPITLNFSVTLIKYADYKYAGAVVNQVAKCGISKLMILLIYINFQGIGLLISYNIRQFG